MKALCTADLHLNENPRDDYRHRFLRTFRDLCRQYKVDTTIILGDITDAKDRHSARLTNQIVDHFYRLAGICEHVIVLPGNHCYTDPEWPFFRFLQRLEGVHYVNQPTHWDNASTPVFRSLGRYLWLPHTHNPKKDWATLPTKEAELIFAHQTFNGANVGFGRKLEGLDPDELLPGNAKIISGDIHVPQTFGRITYVGAPYTVDFGDQFEPRILLLERNKRTSIPCLGPQKRLIEATSIEEAKRKCEETTTEGDIMKIRVSIDNMGNWPETRQNLKEWCEQRGLIPYIIQPIRKASTRMVKSEVSQARTDKQIVLAYAKIKRLEARIIEEGLGFVEES